MYSDSGQIEVEEGVKYHFQICSILFPYQEILSKKIPQKSVSLTTTGERGATLWWAPPKTTTFFDAAVYLCSRYIGECGEGEDKGKPGGLNRNMTLLPCALPDILKARRAKQVTSSYAAPFRSTQAGWVTKHAPKVDIKKDLKGREIINN